MVDDSGYRPDEGKVQFREHVFYFKDVVTSSEFQVVKNLREKHDSIERSDKFEKLTEKESNQITDEWYSTVINVGLKNETLESVRKKLSEGEIRSLVTLTYNFLWMFGSISEAKRYYDTLVKIQKHEEKSSESTPT